jgi:hypothetical protein
VPASIVCAYSHRRTRTLVDVPRPGVKRSGLSGGEVSGVGTEWQAPGSTDCSRAAITRDAPIQQKMPIVRLAAASVPERISIPSAQPTSASKDVQNNTGKPTARRRPASLQDRAVASCESAGSRKVGAAVMANFMHVSCHCRVGPHPSTRTLPIGSGNRYSLRNMLELRPILVNGWRRNGTVCTPRSQAAQICV